MLIYKVTNKANGKIYIGQTTQSLAERWWQHRRRSPSQTHRSALHKAILKYGEDNFQIESIATASTLEELNALEIKFIAEFNCLSPIGYNLLKGGNNKECHPDTRKAIAETLRGRPIKNRMNGAPKGRPVSEARKKQISATMTGVPQPWKYKPVKCVETEVVYESIQAAAKATGIERISLMYLLRSGGQSRDTKLSFVYVDKTLAESKKAA